MANLSEPDEILCEFIRANVTEVTRTGVSNRYTTDSESFDGDDSTTAFTLTAQPACITSVTVDGTTMKKFIDYQIDLDNKKITFTTAPASGTDNVVINIRKFNTGITAHWVYPDKPRTDLKQANYPRVGITTLVEEQTAGGLGANPTFYANVVLQIDIMAHKDQECTINSETKEGQEVANYLARQIWTAIKANDANKLELKLQIPKLISNIPVPFDESKNVFRRIMEVSFFGQNI